VLVSLEVLSFFCHMSHNDFYFHRCCVLRMFLGRYTSLSKLGAVVAATTRKATRMLALFVLSPALSVEHSFKVFKHYMTFSTEV
jgi:hypothetical protein